MTDNIAWADRHNDGNMTPLWFTSHQPELASLAQFRSVYLSEMSIEVFLPMSSPYPVRLHRLAGL